MRGDFVRYNAAIRSQRDDVYARWIRYFAGAITSELHAARRFDGVLQGLNIDDRYSAKALVEEQLAAMRKGSQTLLRGSTPSSNESKKVASLLAAIV